MNEPIKLTDEMADKMLESMDNPPEPSEKLKEAKRLYDRDVKHRTKQLNTGADMNDDRWIDPLFRKPKAREHIVVYSNSLGRPMYGKLVQGHRDPEYDGAEHYLVTDGWTGKGGDFVKLPVDDVSWYLRRPPEPTKEGDCGIWLKGDGSDLKDRFYFVFRKGGANGDRVCVKTNSRYKCEMSFNDYYFYWGIVCDDSEITHYSKIPHPPTLLYDQEITKILKQSTDGVSDD